MFQALGGQLLQQVSFTLGIDNWLDGHACDLAVDHFQLVGEHIVDTQPRLYLLGDMDGCPAKGEPACRQRSYVVNGDTVVTGRDLGAYRCAFFPNRVGGSAGWVDRSKLQPLPVAVPSLQDWAGNWKDGDNGLRITVQGGQLHVEGDAYWPSANPTPEQRPYGPNMGQVEARAAPRGAASAGSTASRTGPFSPASTRRNTSALNAGGAVSSGVG